MGRGDHKPPGASAAMKRPVATSVRAVRHRMRLPRIGHIARAARSCITSIIRALGLNRGRRLGPVRTRGLLALAILGLALLLAGGASARIADVVSEATPTRMSTEPAASPWPTPTPTPQPPPPLSIPPGWQVYRGHHFAVAFPGGWTAFEHVVRDATGGVEAASVSFQTPDGIQAVGIGEHERLDAATLKQYCAQPGTPITYAGLPMITARTAGTLRMFLFVATGGIAYTLLYREESTPQEVKWLYDSILATFHPEFATSACQQNR